MTSPILERLYDRHALGLFHYLRGFTPSDADARDLLQDLFVKIARQGVPPSLRSEKAWMFRLAHNLALDHLRRMQHRRVVDEGERDTAIAPLEDPDAAAIAARMQEAMSDLSAEQRSVFQLKLWEGLTFE